MGPGFASSAGGLTTGGRREVSGVRGGFQGKIWVLRFRRLEELTNWIVEDHLQDLLWVALRVLKFFWGIALFWRLRPRV